MQTIGTWEELWKNIDFEIEFINNYRLEISNWGRIKSFHASANGKLLKGSMTEGYKIVRLKFYKPRDTDTQQILDELSFQIRDLYQEKKQLQKQHQNISAIDEINHQIEKLKSTKSKKYKSDLKKRTIYKQYLIHRLVAQYFIKQPSPEHKIVAHLDYNKLNNKVDNLKWMTPEENIAHQSKSPYVIAEKTSRKFKNKDKTKGSKLSATNVMLIKIQLKRNRPLKEIAKQFKISETHVKRIKTGENWSHVEI